MANIVLNRIQTPDGTILTSYQRHDSVSYKDKNGETYMVDGGLSYLKRSVNQEPYIELSVNDDVDFETIRRSFHWGESINRFTSAMPKVKWTPICELDINHIKGILKGSYGSDWARELLSKEKTYRIDQILKNAKAAVC